MGKKKQMNSIGSGLNFGVDPEALDFSQDTWSWKGDIPNHPIQSDGFSYDIVNENEIDRNAISLGIIGMIIIVYNAKSAKIKEEDVLPAFREVIGTRNWNTISEKEANQMAKTAISKLVDEETSGDVFDLASYAPLEIKRVLLRKLFVIARYRLDPEYRTEAERRITEDIVPSIFADPQIELALLTGLIVKPKPKQEDKYTRQEEKAEESESVPSEEVPEIKGEEELIIPDRDAEEALQERLKTLSKDQPVKKAKKEKPTTEKPEEEYIPFSDMEKELAGSSSPAAEPFNDGFDEFNKPPIAPAEKIPAVKTGSQTQQPKPYRFHRPPCPIFLVLRSRRCPERLIIRRRDRNRAVILPIRNRGKVAPDIRLNPVRELFLILRNLNSRRHAALILRPLITRRIRREMKCRRNSRLIRSRRRLSIPNPENRNPYKS